MRSSIDNQMNLRSLIDFVLEFTSGVDIILEFYLYFLHAERSKYLLPPKLPPLQAALNQFIVYVCGSHLHSVQFRC